MRDRISSSNNAEKQTAISTAESNEALVTIVDMGNDGYVFLHISGLQPRISAKQRGWGKTQYEHLWKIPAKTTVESLSDYLRNTSDGRN